MNFKGILKLLILFLITSTTVLNCRSDDDSTPDNQENHSLLNKWWYDSNDFAADIYFHSNGEFEQKKVVDGVMYTGNGDWFFENENSGIIKIENIEGNGQTLTEIWLKVSNIQRNTLTIQQSVDGIEFTEEFLYLDTDN